MRLILLLGMWLLMAAGCSQNEPAQVDGCSSAAKKGFTAAIDPAIHTLVVDGLNDADYYIPGVAALLPEGNLHVYEFPLYEQSPRRNVMQRIRAYYKKKFFQ